MKNNVENKGQGNSVEFIREKVCAIESISFEAIPDELIADTEFDVGYTADTFCEEELIARLSASIYSNMSEIRTLTYYCKRPTFLDWLLRRRRVVEWELKVKDLLLKPPKLKNRTARIYITEPKY